LQCGSTRCISPGRTRSGPFSDKALVPLVILAAPLGEEAFFAAG
jgi:hypothetical protein